MQVSKDWEVNYTSRTYGVTWNNSSKTKRFKRNIFSLTFNSVYRHSVLCIDISKCCRISFKVTPMPNNHSVNKRNNGRNWPSGLDKVKLFWQKLSINATSFWWMSMYLYCISSPELTAGNIWLYSELLWFHASSGYPTIYSLACLMHAAWTPLDMFINNLLYHKFGITKDIRHHIIRRLVKYVVSNAIQIKHR